LPVAVSELPLHRVAQLPYFHHLAGPILFSASHGTKVWRGGQGEAERVHKAERYTCPSPLLLRFRRCAVSSHHHLLHDDNHIGMIASFCLVRWATDIAARLALAMRSRLGFEGSLMVWNPTLVPGPADKSRLYVHTT
jgi:hypothetical protein